MPIPAFKAKIGPTHGLGRRFRSSAGQGFRNRRTCSGVFDIARPLRQFHWPTVGIGTSRIPKWTRPGSGRDRVRLIQKEIIDQTLSPDVDGGKVHNQDTRRAYNVL